MKTKTKININQILNHKDLIAISTKHNEPYSNNNRFILQHPTLNKKVVKKQTNKRILTFIAIWNTTSFKGKQQNEKHGQLKH